MDHEGSKIAQGEDVERQAGTAVHAEMLWMRARICSKELGMPTQRFTITITDFGKKHAGKIDKLSGVLKGAGKLGINFVGNKVKDLVDKSDSDSDSDLDKKIELGIGLDKNQPQTWTRTLF